MSLVRKLKKLSCQEALWLGELVNTFYAIFVEVQTISCNDRLIDDNYVDECLWGHWWGL